jgi:lipoprotein-anchoring transpeptidase ErfK/SrfK
MRSRAFLFVGLLLVLCLGLVGAVYAYDSSKSGTIAKGVRAGGVDIGGLSAAKARAKLRRTVLRDIRRPVVVAWHGRRFPLTAKQAGLSVDLDATVDEALKRSRSGSIISRTARSLRGKSLDVSLQPQVVYSTRAVRRLVARVGAAVDRPSREAHVSFATTAPTVAAGRDGRRLRRVALRRAVEAALSDRTAARRIPARVTVVHPKTTTAELAGRYPVILTLDRTNFRLRLFKRLKLAKTYTVAVGQAGLDTPAGLYHIQNKAVNPSWHVPNSAWAGSMAGQVVPPGPDNPIKARWMGIWDGAGIHGTDETYSLGHAASHGCVRMAIPDVLELYPQVSVGTPMYIA